MSQRALAITAILISSLLWATAGVVAKILIGTFHPYTATFYRFLVASLIILPVYIQAQKPRGVYKKLIFLSMLAAANVLLFYTALLKTSANIGTLIYATIPIATAIMSSILIGEKHSAQRLFGILVGLIGVGIIIFLPVLEKGQVFSGNLSSNILIVIGMLLWTYYTVETRKILLAKTTTPLVITSIFFFTTTITSLALALIVHAPIPSPWSMSSPTLAMVVYSGVGITLLTFLLFQWAIQHISVTTASLKNYLEPVGAVLLNGIFLGEQITRGFAVGSVFVLAGVAISMIDQYRKNVKRLDSKIKL